MRSMTRDLEGKRGSSRVCIPLLPSYQGSHLELVLSLESKVTAPFKVTSSMLFFLILVTSSCHSFGIKKVIALLTLTRLTSLVVVLHLTHIPVNRPIIKPSLPNYPVLNVSHLFIVGTLTYITVKYKNIGKSSILFKYFPTTGLFSITCYFCISAILDISINNILHQGSYETTSSLAS